MNDLTDKDIINTLSHLPKNVRPYLDKLISESEIIGYCAKVKSREMSRKDFVMVVNRLLSEYLSSQKTKSAILEGFKIGDIKICDGEYWDGKEVEIVDIDNTHHLPIAATHNGTVYRFHPDWFKK